MKGALKRLLSSALAVCLTLGLVLPASASEANRFTVDGITYEVKNNSEVWVVSSNPGYAATGLSGAVTIPKEVSKNDAETDPKYTVTGIGTTAFYGCSNMTELKLPETIITIEAGAFGNCTSLTSLEIPAGVTTGVRELLTGKSSNVIHADYAMPHAEKVTFASGSPYSIVDGVLYNGTVLEHRLDWTQTDVTVRAGTTEILDGAFTTVMGGTPPFSVTFADNAITEIRAGVFTQSELQSITLPESVTKIDDGAFYKCPNLTEINLSNVTEIGEGAFSECEGLARVTWPENLQSLGAMAFGNCASLDSVDIKGSITGIPEMAFLGCGGVKNISLPEGLTSIGMGAFALTFEGGMLGSINIPSTVTSLGAMFLVGVKSDGTTVIDSALADPAVFAATGEMGGEQVPVLGGLGDSKVVFKVPVGAENVYKETLGVGTGNTNIEIKEPDPILVSTVIVAPDTLNLTVGSTGTLTATVGPDTATNQAVTWASSDANIATVDENGVVTAVAPGTATITATAGDVSATCEVTVSAVTVPATGVSVNPAELTLSIGGTDRLTANLEPANATDTVAWSSSNPAVATVENGVVTAAGVGEAVITATAGGYSAACAVTVQPDAIPVTGVTVTADRTSLYNGEVAVLTAAVLPENATDKTVTWTSSDETVATVDASGRVTAVSAGSVTITAAAGGVTSEAVFIVVQGPAPVLVGSVNVNPAALNLTEGDARALTATVGPENATNRAVVWTSSNPSVAAVDGNGVVTALRAGSAVITATAIDGGGASGSCTVAVSAYVDPFASYFPDYFDYPSNSGTTAPAQPAQPAEPETPVIPDEPTPLDPGAEIKDEEVPLSQIPLLFTDVKTGDWHRDAVAFVFSKGIMSGASETKFEPETNIDRGMIVTMLHRLEGTPEAAPSAFTDVLADQYWAEAIGWASQNGVVQGYSDTEFRPSREISREQLASILYRYAQLKGYDTSEQADLSAYSDASNVSGYAKDAMGWAVAKGLISGVTESTLVPGGSATRAQAAMILMRFCENVVPA